MNTVVGNFAAVCTGAAAQCSTREHNDAVAFLFQRRRARVGVVAAEHLGLARRHRADDLLRCASVLARGVRPWRQRSFAIFARRRRHRVPAERGDHPLQRRGPPRIRNRLRGVFPCRLLLDPMVGAEDSVRRPQSLRRPARFDAQRRLQRLPLHPLPEFRLQSAAGLRRRHLEVRRGGRRAGADLSELQHFRLRVCRRRDRKPDHGAEPRCDLRARQHGALVPDRARRALRHLRAAKVPPRDATRRSASDRASPCCKSPWCWPPPTSS